MASRFRIMALSDLSVGRKITSRTHREIMQRAHQVVARHDIDGLYYGGNLIDRHNVNRTDEVLHGLDALAELHTRFKVAVLGINDLRDQWGKGPEVITGVKRDPGEAYFERHVDLYRSRGIHLLDERPFYFGDLALVGGLGGFDGSLFEPVLDWHESDQAVREKFHQVQALVERQFTHDHSWMQMTSAELFAQASTRLTQVLEGFHPENLRGVVLFLHKALSWQGQIHHWHLHDDFKNYKDGSTYYQQLLDDPRVRFAVAGARRRFFTETLHGKTVVDLSSSAHQPYVMELDTSGRLLDIKNYDEIMAMDAEHPATTIFARSRNWLAPHEITEDADYITGFDFKYEFTDLFIKLKSLGKHPPGPGDEAQLEAMRRKVRGLNKVDLSHQDLHRMTDHIFCLYTYCGPWRNITAWIKAIGLDDMLSRVGSIELPFTPAWFVSKEPLPFFPVGQGEGDTAGSLGIEMLRHVARTEYAYEQITINRFDAHPNIGILSREDKFHWGEAAEYGTGCYCTRVEHGSGIAGNYVIYFRLNPNSRRDTDYRIAFDIDAMQPYIIVLNAAAIELVDAPKAGSVEHMLQRGKLFGRYGQRTTTSERPIAL